MENEILESGTAEASGGCTAMIVTVGGSPEPVISTLREARPRCVLFVASEQSRAEVESKILPGLDFAISPNYCVLSDGNRIERIYGELRQQIRDWLRLNGLRPADVAVDITGGTKPMAAGLALAAIEHFSQFRYVSGTRRTKEGLGVVESGTEYTVKSGNPWDVEAVKEREKAAWLYEKGDPAQAARVLEGASEKCSPKQGRALKGYARLMEILDAADRFDFDGAIRKANKFRDAHGILLATETDEFAVTALEELWKHWPAVQGELRKEGPMSATVRELICNADRRAAQSRWDDAVARLYRATEVWMQDLAFQAFGAKLGKVEIGSIPAGRQAEFLDEFGEAEEGGQYLLGVERLARAVSKFGPASCEDAYRVYESLKNHLQLRNTSILAHGNRAASEEDYQGFRAALLTGLGLSEADLPAWPRLRMGS